MTENNQQIKELVSKIRKELGFASPLIVQYLTEIEELAFEETKEQKELYEELEISDNKEKKQVVKEVQRLAQLKGLKVDFKDKIEIDTEANIYLLLNQKDKEGNFCPSLVFWNLAQELATEPDNLPANSQPDEPDKNTGQKNPVFWTNFTRELEWIKENLIVLPIADREKDFRCQFELLLNPSTFPHEKLEIKELLSIYYPTSENITNSQATETKVRKEIVDKLWQNIKEKVLELTSDELKNSPNEEELTKLAFKLSIDYSIPEQYILQINYHSQSPFKEKISELMSTSPLKLENELLKQQNSQLPTPENLAKLEKKNQAWEREVENLGIPEEKLKEIKEKINEIN